VASTDMRPQDYRIFLPGLRYARECGIWDCGERIAKTGQILQQDEFCSRGYWLAHVRSKIQKARFDVILGVKY
jgi:hypothetical protein